MKNVVTLLFGISFSFVSFSQTFGVHWGYPENVGVGTTHNNIYPRLTLTNGDIPVVIWQDNIPARTYSSRKIGAAFSSPLAVHATGINPFVANWAGAEIGSSGDTVFVVFTTIPVASGKAYAVRSIDGGMTFSDTVRINHETGRIPSFPFVTVLPGGNPVVNYMGADTITMANPKHTVAKSIDGGVTFLPNVTPVTPGEACDCCTGTMAFSPTHQALLFRNNISNLREMWTSLSSDTCTSFPVSSNIDTTNWVVSSCPSSAPSGLIVGDSLVYTWMSDGTGDARVYIGTMNINDQQIGQHRQLYPVGLSTQNYPVIAGKGDTLGIVWLGYNGSYQEVLFSWSVTGAAGLGTVIDTITKGLGGHQSRPDLVYNNGKFHVVFSNTAGAQVQYMEGMFVPNVSVDEMDVTPEIIFTSMNSNGVIDMQIYAARELKADVAIYNSMGQVMKNKSLLLTSGSNHDTMEHDLSSGIYFLVLSTSDGTIYQNKIIIAQ